MELTDSESDIPTAIDPLQRIVLLQPLIQQYADVNEAQRHLAPQVAQAFAKQGLYRIAAPLESFGGAIDPVTQVKVIEAVASIDGSASWNLMVGIEAFGLIAPAFEHCRDLIADADVVLSSSSAAVGRAEKVDGGYRVSGQWPFCSGIHNAGIFGATVKVWQNGEMLPEAPKRYAIVTPSQYEILDTWHTSGLCGSGSHDVVIDDVFVPEERLIQPLSEFRHESPLLNFPLGIRIAYNKVGVAWGLARTGIDAFVDIAEGKIPRFSSRGLKQRPRAHRAVAEAEVRLRAGRALVLELLEEIWATVQARDHITSKERAIFQLACSDTVRGSIEAINLVAEAAGTTANQKGHPLERIVRDVRVVGQHTTVAPHHIEDAGRLLLGLPAQEMMLAGMGG